MTATPARKARPARRTSAAAAQQHIKQMRKTVEQAVLAGEKSAEQAWHYAAQAALDWIMAHRTRVAQFRKAVRGTPIAPSVDALIGAVRAEARAPAPRRRAAAKTRRAR